MLFCGLFVLFAFLLESLDERGKNLVNFVAVSGHPLNLLSALFRDFRRKATAGKLRETADFGLICE